MRASRAIGADYLRGGAWSIRYCVPGILRNFASIPGTPIPAPIPGNSGAIPVTRQFRKFRGHDTHFSELLTGFVPNMPNRYCVPGIDRCPRISGFRIFGGVPGFWCPRILPDFVSRNLPGICVAGVAKAFGGVESDGCELIGERLEALREPGPNERVRWLRSRNARSDAEIELNVVPDDEGCPSIHDHRRSAVLFF